MSLSFTEPNLTKPVNSIADYMNSKEMSDDFKNKLKQDAINLPWATRVRLVNEPKGFYKIEGHGGLFVARLDSRRKEDCVTAFCLSWFRCRIFAKATGNDLDAIFDAQIKYGLAWEKQLAAWRLEREFGK